MADEETEFGLVMPFIVCVSQNGPYDDESYVAGWEAGQIDAWLQGESSALVAPTMPVHSANLPQIDLIGMRHGYTVESRVSEEVPEWAYITFSKGQ